MALILAVLIRSAVGGAYGARILAEVSGQTARSILDGEGGAVLHICAGFSGVILVVKHWKENRRLDSRFVPGLVPEETDSRQAMSIREQ